MKNIKCSVKCRKIVLLKHEASLLLVLVFYEMYTGMENFILQKFQGQGLATDALIHRRIKSQGKKTLYMVIDVAVKMRYFQNSHPCC